MDATFLRGLLGKLNAPHVGGSPLHVYSEMLDIKSVLKDLLESMVGEVEHQRQDDSLDDDEEEDYQVQMDRLRSMGVKEISPQKAGKSLYIVCDNRHNDIQILALLEGVGNPCKFKDEYCALLRQKTATAKAVNPRARIQKFTKMGFIDWLVASKEYTWHPYEEVEIGFIK